MRPGGQRAKGNAFERKVASMIRDRWPSALVRRASQAERAHNPDVFVEGGPLILRRLWLELQDSARPTPSTKLEQARNDVAADPRTYEIGYSRIPAAVTHKRGAREILVTMNVGDIMNIIDLDGDHFESRGEVTIDFEQWRWFVARKGQAEDLKPPVLIVGSKWRTELAAVIRANGVPGYSEGT